MFPVYVYGTTDIKLLFLWLRFLVTDREKLKLSQGDVGTSYISERVRMGAAIVIGSEIAQRGHCMLEILERIDGVSRFRQTTILSVCRVLILIGPMGP